MPCQCVPQTFRAGRRVSKSPDRETEAQGDRVSGQCETKIPNAPLASPCSGPRAGQCQYQERRAFPGLLTVGRGDRYSPAHQDLRCPWLRRPYRKATNPNPQIPMSWLTRTQHPQDTVLMPVKRGQDSVGFHPNFTPLDQNDSKLGTVFPFLGTLCMERDAPN